MDAGVVEDMKGDGRDQEYQSYEAEGVEEGDQTITIEPEEGPTDFRSQGSCLLVGRWGPPVTAARVALRGTLQLYRIVRASMSLCSWRCDLPSFVAAILIGYLPFTSASGPTSLPSTTYHVASSSRLS